MTLGFGIIGSGYMGRTYAACLARHTTGGRLVAVTGGTRATALAAEFSAAAMPNVEALVGRPDIDAVVIASPHSAHLANTRDAAAAGKHVYVEKPMARDTAECDAMIAACRAAGVQLAVNKVLRFRHAAGAAHEVIERGDIGQIRMIKARYVYPVMFVADKLWTQDREEGSPFLNWGAHSADLIRWMTGSEATLAFARYANFSHGRLPDQTAMVQWTLESRALAQAWMSFELARPGLRPSDSYLFVGSDGMIELETFGKVRLGKGDHWETVTEQPAFDFLANPLDPQRLKGFAAQVQDFIEAISHARPPRVGGLDGRAAVEMVEAADRSAASGEAVAIPFGPLRGDDYSARRRTLQPAFA